MTLTAQTVREWGAELSNWGRWGDDDEIGTLNLITPDCVAAAAASVREGLVVSCAIAFDAAGPMPGVGRMNPRHTMTQTGHDQEFPGGFHYADDDLELTLQCGTQWDALSHVYYDGHLYNGRPESVITSEGAHANSIDRLRERVVGRGVLLDVAAALGVDALDDGTAISPDDLEAAATAQGVEIMPGDILLVRTGRMGRVHRDGEWGQSYVFGPAPGLSVRCAHWLKEKDVAAVGCDNVGVEVMPPEVEDCMMPLHMICLRDMGLTFGEIFDLERLATVAHERGRFDFFFIAAPLPITGAVGSPINPIAIF
ncbi:MAG TPA: cyclase family protein [Acidimicrobiia bacterium]|jgi:kynurenine formamidase